MPFRQRREFRRALQEFVNFESWLFPMGVTLTHRLAVTAFFGVAKGTPEIYRQNLRHFLNCLERIFLTRSERRRGKHLRVFASLESDQSGRKHYHLMIEKPENADEERFRNIITGEWQKTHWGHREVDVRPVETSEWIAYLSKCELGTSEPAIDWENSRL